MMESVVNEGDVPNTVVVWVAWHGTNCHTNTKSHVTIADCDVLRAVGDLMAHAQRLDSHSIVVVSDVDPLDEDVGASWVDSIGVQWV